MGIINYLNETKNNLSNQAITYTTALGTLLLSGCATQTHDYNLTKNKPPKQEENLSEIVNNQTSLINNSTIENTKQILNPYDDFKDSWKHAKDGEITSSLKEAAEGTITLGAYGLLYSKINEDDSNNNSGTTDDSPNSPTPPGPHPH